MAVVKDSDLGVVFSLLEAALGSAFRAGGVLDQWEEEGESVARASKAVGMDGGWGAEDIHWK